MQFASLMVKISRIQKIFKNPSLKLVSISVMKLQKVVGFVVLLNLVFLTLNQLVSPPKWYIISSILSIIIYILHSIILVYILNIPKY